MTGRLVSQGRQWPDELDDLLLRAALLNGDDAARAWRSWTQRGGDVDDLENESRRLLPLIYRNLSGAGDSDRGRLKDAYRSSWAANQRLLDRAAGAIDALKAADLDTMVLKGAALAVLHYRDMGARPMGDVDVLVRTRCAEQALAALQDAGWRPLEADVQRVVRLQHATPLRYEGRAEIDLHWRLLVQAARDDDVWEAAVPIGVAGVSSMALCPTDQLLHVCVHGLVSAPVPVRWVADAMTVLASAGRAIDWNRLIERARARRVTVPLTAALEHLRAEFSVDLPEPALAELRESRTTPRERFAHRVAMNPPPRGRRYVSLWDRYRRLRTVEHDSHVPDGYLDFLVGSLRLNGRREVVPWLARKARQAAPPRS